MSSIADPLTIRPNFLMSWLNLSFSRPIDQKLFQTMTKLTEGLSARDFFREAETLFAQGADPNAVGTDVDTGKSVHMLAGLLYGPSDWLNCSMIRLAEFFCLTRIRSSSRQRKKRSASVGLCVLSERSQ